MSQANDDDGGMDIASALGIELPNGMKFEDLPQELAQQLLQEFLFRSQLYSQSARGKLSHINTIEDTVDLINKSSKILVLTGAGISVSAGIPDFRSENGLYSTLKSRFNLTDPTTMFDMKYFINNPSLFYSFGGDICPGFDNKLIKYYPTSTHYFIKLLELNNKLLRLYTQNIDTLEMRAGINKLITCHGSYVSASCVNCSFKCSGADIQKHIFEERIPFCPYCKPQKSDLSQLKTDNKHDPIIKENKYGNIIAIRLPKLLCTVSMLQNGCPIIFSYDNNVLQKAIYDDDDDIDIMGDGDKKKKEDVDLNYKTLVLKCDDPYILSVCKQTIMYWLKSSVASFGVIKPDITFFNEALSSNYHETLEKDVKECDLLLILGTSLQVHPVASIPTKVPENIPQILINREVVGYPNKFDVNLLGNCDDVCETLVDKLNWNMIEPKNKYNINNENENERDEKMNDINDDNSTTTEITPIETFNRKANKIKYEYVKPNYYVFPNGKLPQDINDDNDDDGDVEIYDKEAMKDVDDVVDDIIKEEKQNMNKNDNNNNKNDKNDNNNNDGNDNDYDNLIEVD